MFLRHEVEVVLIFTLFIFLCFFVFFSSPPREITVLWDDERTYINARVILYTEQRKKSRIIFLTLLNVYRVIRNRSCKTVRIYCIIISFSLSLSHSFSPTLLSIFISSLPKLENKRDENSQQYPNPAKNSFFISFLFVNRSISFKHAANVQFFSSFVLSVLSLMRATKCLVHRSFTRIRLNFYWNLTSKTKILDACFALSGRFNFIGTKEERARKKNLIKSSNDRSNVVKSCFYIVEEEKQ